MIGSPRLTFLARNRSTVGVIILKKPIWPRSTRIGTKSFVYGRRRRRKAWDRATAWSSSHSSVLTHRWVNGTMLCNFLLHLPRSQVEWRAQSAIYGQG